MPLPYDFVPNTRIISEQVDANFNYLFNLINRNYIEDLIGIVLGKTTEIIAAYAITNTAILQAAFDALSLVGGGVFYLKSSSVISCAYRINIPSNIKIIYEGPQSLRPSFYMPAIYFNNTAVNSPFIYANGCLFSIQGLTVNPYTPVTDVTLQGFTIESQVQDNRVLNAISIRNTTNVTLNDLEIYGLPLGYAINADSMLDSSMDELYIHDCTTNVSTWTPGSYCNVSAISFDNGSINSVGSRNIKINNITIENVYVGTTFRAVLGDQSDGFTFANRSSEILCTQITGINTGELFDVQGTDIVINGFRGKTLQSFCVKLVHGAKNCTITNGSIEDMGVGGIVIAGSDGLASDTTNNTISNISMKGFINDVYYAAINRSCIRLMGNPAFPGKAHNNLITNITADATGGSYIFSDDTLGGAPNNAVTNIECVAGGSLGIAQITDKTNVFKPARPTNVIATALTQTTVNAGATEYIAYTTEELDVLAEYDTTTSTYTAKYPGPRLITASNRFQSSVIGQVYSIRIAKSNVDTRTKIAVAGAVVNLDLDLTSTIWLNAGETLRIKMTNSSAANSDSTANAEIAFFTISHA